MLPSAGRLTAVRLDKITSFQSHMPQKACNPSATGKTGAYAQHLVRKLQAQQELLLKYSLSGIHHCGEGKISNKHKLQN